MALEKQEVLAAIAEVLDVDTEEIKEGVSLADSIGVDSTEMVELNVALEKKFNIKLLKDEISKDSKPEEIFEIINKKLTANETN